MQLNMLNILRVKQISLQNTFLLSTNSKNLHNRQYMTIYLAHQSQRDIPLPWLKGVSFAVDKKKKKKLCATEQFIFGNEGH